MNEELRKIIKDAGINKINDSDLEKLLDIFVKESAKIIWKISPTDRSSNIMVALEKYFKK